MWTPHHPPFVNFAKYTHKENNMKLKNETIEKGKSILGALIVCALITFLLVGIIVTSVAAVHYTVAKAAPEAVINLTICTFLSTVGMAILISAEGK